MLKLKLMKNKKRLFLACFAIICFTFISTFATRANYLNDTTNVVDKQTMSIKSNQNPRPIPPECADPECRYNPYTRDCVCPGPR
jgi:hypothetical protein